MCPFVTPPPISTIQKATQGHSSACHNTAELCQSHKAAGVEKCPRPSGTQRLSLHTNSLAYSVRQGNSYIPVIDVIRFVVNTTVLAPHRGLNTRILSFTFPLANGRFHSSSKISQHLSMDWQNEICTDIRGPQRRNPTDSLAPTIKLKFFIYWDISQQLLAGLP